MKEYVLPKTRETFTANKKTYGTTYTVLASKPKKMLLLRHNRDGSSTYVVAYGPQATEGLMGDRDFHWDYAHYYDMLRNDNDNTLMSAMKDYLQK